MKKRPKIGLALGGGAARGYAHIGVIKVLTEEKIPIDFISGTSIGALIGALYSVGIDIQMLEKLALSIKRENWVDFIIPRKGLLAGKKIEQIIRLLTKNKNLEEVDIPLTVTATDLKTGKEVLLRKGNIAKAVRASISIPGIFVPVIMENMILVDGAVLNKVPADAVRQMGADIVIAVDLGFDKRIRLNNIYDILLQTFDIMGRELLKTKILNADIIIRPKLGDIDPSNFNQPKDCIIEGEKAARDALPKILQFLKEGVQD
ncbi:MAG: hypothetical protein PWQ82_902 [Thermosediminibacterales bacterium]|nr:hypothetical protein [Thermosediminibacterales bacterium]MDK2835443.1 hypothetical protein [Thermosediminibacterales bacterium]